MALATRRGRGEGEERQVVAPLQHSDGAGDGLGALAIILRDPILRCQRRVGGVLGRLYVGLVEGVDPKLGTRRGDGDFEGHVERTHVEGLAQVEHEDGNTRCTDQCHVVVVLAREPQVQDDAVKPVLIRVAQRLAGDRDDALAILAQTLGHQLLGPQPERSDTWVGNDGELVAPRPGQCGECHAQPWAIRPLARGSSAVEHVGDGHPGQSHRDEAEQGEGREPATHVGHVLGHHAPALVGGANGQRSARVGDGHKAVAPRLTQGVLDEQTHMRGECQRLCRGTALARDDGQTRGGVNALSNTGDGHRVGGIEHAQLNAVTMAECAAGDLGRQARPAHAQNERVADALLMAGGHQ